MAFTTKGSLLAAVKKGDEISWQQFYDMYKPLILLKGGDLRLNQTEKEELVQLVMLSFFNTSQTFCYDKSKGRFRDYLKRIIHNKACDLMCKRQDDTVSSEELKKELEYRDQGKSVAIAITMATTSCNALFIMTRQGIPILL